MSVKYILQQNVQICIHLKHSFKLLVYPRFFFDLSIFHKPINDHKPIAPRPADKLADALSLDDSSFNKIYLYPNPSSDIVNIKGADLEFDAKVTDLSGKQVMRKYITDKLDISTLEKGIYIINLTDGATSSFHKIIKN